MNELLKVWCDELHQTSFEFSELFDYETVVMGCGTFIKS
jgi:hypothetical protein